MPVPQASAAPELLVPSVGRKPRRDKLCPQHCRSPYSDPTPCGLQENLEWKNGIWLWQKRKEGLATASILILLDWVHTCTSQLVIPSSNSFVCQTNSGVYSDQGTQWSADLLYLNPQMRYFAGFKAQFADNQARCRVTSSPTVQSIF